VDAGGGVTARLELRGIGKVYGDGRKAVVALEDITMHVERGEFVCMAGASGCGKSTLLNIVAGLVRPTAGDALIDDHPILGPGPDRGIVFQNYSLFPWRTVAENVAFGLEVAGRTKNEVRDLVDYYLGVMDLRKWASARPGQLSGGMRQRVAIARSLAAEPEVLLLDEPFGALDAHTRSLMQDFLLAVWRQTGTTVLMVTHDVEEALFLAQRIYVLSSHPGRIKRELAVPFADRDPAIRRSEAFLDLRDEIHGLLLAEVAEV
jgi:NitT/TauT family transport system ATP-binding protein